VRRTIGIVASVVLVGLGALLLIGYVQGAEERALAGEELVGVYVVDQPVDQGATSEEVIQAVRLEQVPVKVQAEGGVAALEEIDGLVTAVDLVPGEQVVAARFVDPADIAAYTPVELPADRYAVTLSLAPHRALGGQLAPGDVVAVIASFDPFDISAVEPGTTETIVLPGSEGGDVFVGSTGEGDEPAMRTPNTTHVILDDILVLNVQVEQLPTETAEDGDAPALAPTGNLLITLAARAPDVEKIVFTAEHGFVWLAEVGPTATTAGTEIQTRGTIYR
jgi:pilus assembly protein CpaB